MSIFVLDACALIAYINKEDGWDVIRDMYNQAFEDKNTDIYMNKLNLLECYYDVIKKLGVEDADWTMKTVREMPINVVDCWDKDDVVFKKAGYFKSKYKMSLADSVALAESEARGGSLVTSDHGEFDAVERSENISIKWFR